MAKPSILQCSKHLADKKLTIAFAESATAGWLCSEFALAPESGQVLKGGIVCYDASLKQSILKVPESLFEQYTPESQEVTDELATRLRAVIPADVCVGVTGLTTPGGSETSEKPVGTMFVSVTVDNRLFNARWEFNGSSEDVIHKTVDAVSQLLINNI